jgi:hypothetical protein
MGRDAFLFSALENDFQRGGLVDVGREELFACLRLLGDSLAPLGAGRCLFFMAPA